MDQNQKKEELPENSNVFKGLGFQKIDTSVRQSIAIVREAKEGRRQVLPTSWKRLNRNLLGGLQQGKMYVVAGRPGVGKSAFSNQLVFDVLDTNAHKDIIVLYWTFEMPGYQQVMRSASKDVSKQLAELLSVDMSLSDSDFSNYAMKVRKYEHYPIYFNNVPRTMEYIIEANEKIVEESPDSIIINVYDHSRLIRGNEDSELKKLNTISKGCMLLQSQFNVVNVLLSQLNRNIEQEHRARNQYQPLLTDLFGGDSIGQDAHVVMILNRPNDLYGITEKYCDEDPVGLMAVHIEKNRDGMLGMIAYEADMSTFNITERK
jgi:replicative DNA helicase